MILSANEQRSAEENLSALPATRKWASRVFRRLEAIASIPAGARVLDLGSAGGGFLVAAAELGYRCDGVEPWAPARIEAERLGEQTGVRISVLDGSAESIPFESQTFDVVHASSVIEHVHDVGRALREVHRVLRPGGVFWFNAASAMCPIQDEIRGFPFFGWYPDSVKLTIMYWARDHRPRLVAYSRTPAINWFTPAKAHRLLREHGFSRTFDRWDLRLPDEGGIGYRAALCLIRMSRAPRLLADVLVPGCSFAAIK